MSSKTLFGLPLLDTCPCGEIVTQDDRRHVVFDYLGQVWHRVCEACLQAEPPQNLN